MNKDYAEINTATGDCIATINSHVRPITPTGRQMVEYDSAVIDPIGKKLVGSLWVDIPKPPKPPTPTKLSELDLTKTLTGDGKDLILRKIDQDMISRGID